MSSETVSDKHIAFDLDDTLCRSEIPFASWYLKNYQIDLSDKSSSQVWSYVRELGFGSREILKMIYAFSESDEFAAAPAFPGSNEVLTELSEDDNRLSFITSRPFPKEVSKKWILKNFPEVRLPKDGQFPLYKAYGYEMSNQDDLTKGEICRMIGVDAIVENSLRHAEECLKYNIRVVLFDDEGQYVGYELPEDIVRVSSWKDVPVALSRALGVLV